MNDTGLGGLQKKNEDFFRRRTDTYAHMFPSACKRVTSIKSNTKILTSIESLCIGWSFLSPVDINMIS